MKICLCHDNTIRDNGTARHCFDALKAIAPEAGVEVFHALPREPWPAADWFLWVDDGRDDISILPPAPWAYYAIDTHLGYAYRRWKASQATLAFVAQKNAVEEFARDGVKADWLPLACDPEVHLNAQELVERKGLKPEDVAKRYAVAFVGYVRDDNAVGFNNRVDYLDRLFREIPSFWFATNRFWEEMALRMVRAKVGFNVSVKSDLNMRVFEILSCGVPLLTNRDVVGIGDLFTEGQHYVGYKGLDEMVEKARWMLSGGVDLDELGRIGMNEVRNRHTYRHRMATVLEEISHV